MPIYSGILILAIVLMLIETASALLLRRIVRRGEVTNEAGKELQNQISQRRQTDYHQLAREMGELYYKNARYHPTRWYALPSDYKGAYVSTDCFGLRINRAQVAEKAARILCFGGSTMFSTTTRDEGAIPEIINRSLERDRVVALNHGVGGYSTYAEIGAFCEAIRRETNIVAAVFYDGVNEIAMYVEMVQRNPVDPLYLHAGYPFMTVTEVALRNFVREKEEYRLRSLALTRHALQWVRRKFQGHERASPFDSADLFWHASRIADSYAINLRILCEIARAHGIIPIFIWQPDIFTTRKDLTQRERTIYSKYPSFMAELTVKTKNLVFANQSLRSTGLIDGTGWLDSLAGEHFFDYCHVSEEANEMLAGNIAAILREKAPKTVWRHSR